ncbi:MAG: putative selenate reductase subunit YgfK [Bacteroidales bacterium]|nr:putative selenate reductase subunit YgfK [Bacteroidales bacterium]MCF8456778.1 putative selenate reductase subunit YgfK [Bacteroidales bacterium]
MSDKFSIISLPQLLQIILDEYNMDKSIFGIPDELFFIPNKNDNFRTYRFGQLLETPIGVAAGPHTQLAQNIVAAWLCGARFIELKTIQTLDELEISKPCIDMQDEGYNCEWSQELKIPESFEQYLNAWIIIHILKHKLNIGSMDEPGFIFNMSVGYNLEGILKENVQWFFAKMKDASMELQQKIKSIKTIYPEIEKLKISSQISDNITLSTMHGCPPDEIERIGEYLITEKKIHTAIKLNPTLLGKEELSQILKNSGFETQVPDMAFVHDLKYRDALKIIRNLQTKADKQNLQFSIKLTNTLESRNHKAVFAPNQKMMYMSGRALHPISIRLAQKLQNEFEGKLDISFSGGVDAFNVADVVSCSLHPATVCTDLLKPGGYARLNQYIEELRKKEVVHSETVSLKNLNMYADEVLQNKDFQKTTLHDPSIKTARPLGFFDCIHAPCEDTCPTNQAIPSYMYYTARGNFDKAAEIILSTNPFPNTTGMVCDHLCQTKCTRLNYDSPLLIREIKRFVAENTLPIPKEISTQKKHGGKVAIIGAGPSGLSCAYFLVKAGFEVSIFESKAKPGGMVSGAIPSFRLTDVAFDLDVNRIKGLGVKIEFNHSIDKSRFEEIRKENDFVYIAAGAQKSKPYHLKGMNSDDFLDPLDFLFKVKKNKPSGVCQNVVIIGGGNTAMDAARTAFRLVGNEGKVTIIYRRTIKQMPADLGEIKAVIEEGAEILELTDPISATKKGSNFVITCRKMQLGEKDGSGRARPIPVPDSEFEILADTIIPAIGQDLDVDFIETGLLSTQPGSYETKLTNVFIGGDSMRGASTAINAIGDGRKAAQEMIDKAGINFNTRPIAERPEKSIRQHIIDKAKRIRPQTIRETALDDRKNFKLVSSPLTKEEAITEASRCLLCDEVCNVCTTVCPNLALKYYEVEPVGYQLQKIKVKSGKVEIMEGQSFKVDQKIQILHLADWCNQCGNCTTFCPSSGSPYLDKPHLFFSKKTFDETDQGYYFDKENSELIGKKQGQQFSLKEKEDCLIFRIESVEINLNKKDFRIIDVQSKEKKNCEIDLKLAAEMSVVWQGVNSD